MNKDIRWLALAFFLVAILLRFLPHWHNVTPMAALALFAGCYLSGRVGLILAFGAMAFSDMLGHWLQIPGMGFYNQTTMLTVYLALGLTAMIGTCLRGRVNPLTVPLASLAGTLVFFLTTNFACWFDPMLGYAQTPSGLAQCYVNALPFARNTLLGDLGYSAFVFGAYALLLAPQRSAAGKRTSPLSAN
ncbi:MAG: hypothetical protein KDA45_06025 [Planctomycetales bacterium]|nr:hypothetical protein [Planctomycetales bacterium]